VLYLDQYTTLCKLEADISRVARQPRLKANGEKYYSISFDVVMKFGLTELQAHLRWMEEVKETLFFLIKSLILSVAHNS